MSVGTSISAFISLYNCPYSYSYIPISVICFAICSFIPFISGMDWPGFINGIKIVVLSG